MVLGIDLGSSNTVIATIAKDGTPVIVPDFNSKNEQSTPSIIMLENNRAFVGTVAQNLYELNPDRELLKFFKRRFGTQLPLCTALQNSPFFSETAAAMVLKKIIFDAKLFVNEPIDKCVITIPSHFNDAQRRSVIEAAKLADLELTTILDEPIAAAILYRKQLHNNAEELIMVYDLGGGTFDLTLLTNADDRIHVIAKGGISNLGGKEFDEIIERKIRDTYQILYRENIKDNNLNKNKLKTIAEEIKIRLNTIDQEGFSTWIYLDNHFFKIFFDKAAYIALASKLIEKTEQAVNKSLRSVGLQLIDIHKIVLIGGASSSPLVYDYWKQKIDLDKQTIIYHQPLTSVAKGAALYADSISKNAMGFQSSIELNNVSTYHIALQDINSGELEVIVSKNLPLPVSGIKRIYITPQQPTQYQFRLVQFFDQSEEVQELGLIRIPEVPLKTVAYELELIVENKVNGTLGLKVKDSQTKQNIKFDFTKKSQLHEYNFDEQYKLINSYYINSISS
ncbi:Hsp70 family protein [Sphingobacterium multivorum]|uniref:Hsp70 family protein n=1 Tax=Sphingobacterium multivorum TaxID=28454 RepID=UPI0028AE3C66|nr:Hsp70 family protein [Sphingobacterium multivorum]